VSPTTGARVEELALIKARRAHRLAEEARAAEAREARERATRAAARARVEEHFARFAKRNKAAPSSAGGASPRGSADSSFVRNASGAGVLGTPSAASKWFPSASDATVERGGERGAGAGGLAGPAHQRAFDLERHHRLWKGPPPPLPCVLNGHVSSLLPY